MARATREARAAIDDATVIEADISAFLPRRWRTRAPREVSPRAPRSPILSGGHLPRQLADATTHDSRARDCLFRPRVIEDVSFSRAARGPRWTRRDLWGRMRLSWKFPNDTSLASIARWGLACSGVATLACAFIADAPEAAVDAAPEPLSTDARDPDALARWMRRARAREAPEPSSATPLPRRSLGPRPATRGQRRSRAGADVVVERVPRALISHPSPTAPTMPAPDALPPVVCAVTTRSGSGFGVFCSLRDAPCCSSPCTSSVASRMPDSPRGSRRRRAPPPRASATGRHARAQPRPARGSTAGREPHGLRPRRVWVPTGVPREAFRPLEASVETAEVAAGDEIFVGASSTGTRVRDEPATEAEADSHARTEWRRGFVTIPPRDRAGVTVRYSARTVPGWSGAPVVVRERRAGLDDDVPEPRRAAGRLLAVHRAGADGADGEGITACEIARDVLETVATAGVRKAAAAGTSRRRWRSWRGRSGTRAARDARGGGGGGGGGGTTGVGDGGDGAVDRTRWIRARGRREVGDGGGGVGEGVGEVDLRASEIGEARGGDVSRAGRVGEGGDRREGRRRGRGRVRVASDRDAPGIGGHSGQGEWAMRMRRREDAGGSVVVQTQVRRLLKSVFISRERGASTIVDRLGFPRQSASHISRAGRRRRAFSGRFAPCEGRRTCRCRPGVGTSTVPSPWARARSSPVASDCTSCACWWLRRLPRGMHGAALGAPRR